eukprot:3933726-Rhodomonas_salina.4
MHVTCVEVTSSATESSTPNLHIEVRPARNPPPNTCTTSPPKLLPSLGCTLNTCTASNTCSSRPLPTYVSPSIDNPTL